MRASARVAVLIYVCGYVCAFVCAQTCMHAYLCVRALYTVEINYNVYAAPMDPSVTLDAQHRNHDRIAPSTVNGS